jgi:starch synthase
MIASEALPWSKTGGLADVVGALPAALDDLGHQVTLVLPKYKGVQPVGADVRDHRLRQGSRDHAIRWHILPQTARRRVVFVESPELFERAGLYGEHGADYTDNAERFDALCLAALEFASIDERPVDVVHAHDWQGSLALVRLHTEDRWRTLRRTGRVLTVHNLAYQGLFPKEIVPFLGLSWDAFRMEVGEFWGQFSCLKAGINTADVVTTVSPTYARESLTKADGAGLDGVLRSLGGRYVGILNGIDMTVWNPMADAFLPQEFSADDLAGKATAKRAVLDEFGLPQGDDALGRPLVGMVSRLVEQKGLDLIEQTSSELVALDASYVFLGTGERRYEAALAALAAAHPSRVGVRIGFDERLAHLVEAGADIFLMPSSFEPCGLNQMYSLRYGAVPVVRNVGGLHDTIQPYTARARHANGFKFRGSEPAAFLRAVRQAVRLYHNPTAWRKLVQNGMAADHSWRTSAREYGKVYRRARAAGAGRGRGEAAPPAKG